MGFLFGDQKSINRLQKREFECLKILINTFEISSYQIQDDCIIKLGIRGKRYKESGIIPPCINDLTNLAELDIGLFEKIRFSPNLGSFLGLKSLSIRMVQLQAGLVRGEIPFGPHATEKDLPFPVPFKKMPGLERLSLEDCHLECIPPEIGFLKGLKTLNLSSNAIRMLPEELGQLQSLTRLDLSVNYISRLPTSFSQLHMLQDLSIQSTLLEELPDDINNVRDLKVLSLEKCRLKILPSGITELANMKELYLAVNPLGQLPENIGHLPTLETLTIERTLIRTLPPSFRQLKSLRMLSIDLGQWVDFDSPSKDILNAMIDEGCIVQVNLSWDDEVVDDGKPSPGREYTEIKKGETNATLKQAVDILLRERKR